MKKIKFLILLILISINNFYSNELDYKLKLSLEPLRNGEFLDWSYDSEKKGLYVYKNSNSKKVLYDTIEPLSWNNWQVSKDRKKIIYWEKPPEHENKDTFDYYLLDGNSGKTVCLGKFPGGHTSSDFKYLINKDSKVEPKVKFNLYNLETKQLEKEIFWNLKSEKYFSDEENSTYILRSDRPEYDFHIFIVGMGRYIFAEGYYSISQNKIVTLFDDEEEDRILDLNLFSKFELGK